MLFKYLYLAVLIQLAGINAGLANDTLAGLPVISSAGTVDSLNKPVFDNEQLNEAIRRFTDIYDQYYMDVQKDQSEAHLTLRARLQAANTEIVKYTDDLNQEELQNLYAYLDGYGSQTAQKIQRYYQEMISGMEAEIEKNNREEAEQQEEMKRQEAEEAGNTR